MLTQYHSSVIHNWRVHFWSPLSTTKVPLYCHKMIGRWLIKHYRIVNIIIICIVLTTILLMDTHISILGPLLPKVDMILNITLYEKVPGEHVLPSPGPAASQLPFSVLLWPRVWGRLRRLLWTALQCHHRSDQVGVVSIFYVTSNLSGILHVHHYFTGVGKFNSAKRSYFNQFLYLRQIF